MIRLHTEEELQRAKTKLPNEIIGDILISINEISRFPDMGERQTFRCGPAVVIYKPEESGELRATMPITFNAEPDEEEFFINRRHVITKRLFVVPRMNSEVITYLVERNQPNHD